MSAETRDLLANHPRLVLANHSQKEQLLNPEITDTWLIQFLLSLVQSCATPVLITALNTDHSPGTWHNPPGRGVDCWNADWASAGDDDVRFILQQAAYISCTGQPKLIEVGLSSVAAQYKDSFNYCCDNVFVEDYGHDNAHVHFAVGTPT